MKQIQTNQREQSIIKNTPATLYMKNSQVIFWFYTPRKKIAINTNSSPVSRLAQDLGVVTFVLWSILERMNCWGHT